MRGKSMIVLRILHGAGQGNQMFMYATAYALARKTKQKIFIYVETDYKRAKERPYVLDKFTLNRKYIKKVVRMDRIKNITLYKIINKMWGLFFKLLPHHYTLIEKEKESRHLKEIPLTYKNYILNGCFECSSYFDVYKEELFLQFCFNFTVDEETKQIFEEISQIDSVALHIRLGDFVKEGRSFNTQYYIEKMRIVQEKNPNCIFYVACQDAKVIEKLKEYGPIRVISTQGENKDLKDWNCLRLCKRHILTNSTYSWWAAYLSKRVDILLPPKDLYLNCQNSEDEQTYTNFFAWMEE